MADTPFHSTPPQNTATLQLDTVSGALLMRYYGQPDLLAAETALSNLIEQLNALPRRLVILDLTHANPWLPAETRRMLSEKSKAVQAEKQALIVANPVARMLAKTMMVWLGPQANVKFVKDLEEAREYIRGN